MNKKFAKTTWLIIIVLFIALQIYNIYRSNFDDIIITMLIVALPLIVIGGVYFYNKK